jgi:hypothetical protein
MEMATLIGTHVALNEKERAKKTMERATLIGTGNRGKRR